MLQNQLAQFKARCAVCVLYNHLLCAGNVISSSSFVHMLRCATSCMSLRLGTLYYTGLWQSVVNSEYVVKPSELCKPGKCSAAAAPLMSVTALGFAHLVLPSLKPDYVVWNCGHWSGKLLLQVLAVTGM
jgi:hypothetical protein